MSTFDFSSLITDRSNEDVLRWLALAAKDYAAMTAEEKAAWDGDMKGAYNATDLNRVTAAGAYLAERLRGCGYAVAYAPVEVPHSGGDERDPYTWYEEDIPTSTQMRQYLANLLPLRQAVSDMLEHYEAQMQYPMPDTPVNMDGLTYQEANAIEQILKSIYDQLQRMDAQLYWYNSGDLYAGEV